MSEPFGIVTGIFDETEDVKKKIGLTSEFFEGTKYIRVEFIFVDKKMARHKGFFRLLFENDSYEGNVDNIPQKGSIVKIVRRGFFGGHTVDVPGLNRFVNLVKFRVGEN